MKLKDRAFVLFELKLFLALIFLTLAPVVFLFIEEARFRLKKSHFLQIDLQKAHENSKSYKKNDQFHRDADKFFRKPEPYEVEW